MHPSYLHFELFFPILTKELFKCIFRNSKLQTLMTKNFSPLLYHFNRIGVSEKGSANVKLSVTMAPGHSSMPPRESSIGILAAAVKRCEV